MTQQKKPLAFSYVRFSTPEQQKGDSLRRQLVMAEDYADRHGLDLDRTLTFRDLGVSAFRGANAEVGRLAEFLESIRAGLVPVGSYLLVESLDRISRQSARRAMRMLEEICDAGVKLVTLSDNRVYTKENLDNDPTSLLMSLLTFIRANEESSTKSRRLSAAWANKRSNAKDRPITSRCPAWLILDAGRFKVIPEHGAVVRRIFKLARGGAGQHRITQLLNEERVPTFGRAKFWQRSYVVKILSNSAVTGTLTPHRIEYRDGKKTRVPLDPIPNYYPQIITAADFAALNAHQTESRAPSRGRHANAPLSNLLAGLAACPRCGGTMTLTNKGSRARKKFVCAKAKAGAKCKYQSVTYEDVETTLQLDPKGLARSCIKTHPGDAAISAELAELNDRMSEDRDILESLIETAGRVRSPRVAKEIADVEARLEPLRARWRELRDKSVAMAPALLKARLNDYVTASSADPIDKGKINAALRRVLNRVVIDYRKNALCLEWVHGGQTILPGFIPPKFE